MYVLIKTGWRVILESTYEVIMKINKFHNIIKEIIEEHGDDYIVKIPKGDKYKPLDKVVVSTEDVIFLDFFGEYFGR
jgi:hypothetical protein